MKLDMVFEFRANELETFALVSAVIGVVMFFVGLCWDMIAKSQFIVYRPGLGAMQIIWMAGSALYVLWAGSIFMKWGDR
jgi:hypothetical protein